MGRTPENIDAERIAVIGEYIEQISDSLVTEWEAFSRQENPQASNEQRGALRNELPELLREYGRALREGRMVKLWGRAAEHGTQRYRLGWSPEALARDFMLLRRLLLARLQREANLSVEEMMQIAVAFDESVAASIAVYMRHYERQRSEFVAALRRSNEELKRFAHVVAHEIRNPLSSVLMAAHRIERDVGEEGPLHDAVHAVTRAVGTIRSVTDDLLRYADFETAEEKVEEVDLGEVVRESIASLEPMIADTGAVVEVADELRAAGQEDGGGEKETGPRVRGYREGLKQLFTNLIENAIKYAVDEPPRVRVYRAPEQDAIVVEDNGCGVPPEQRERIFQFFKRAHAQADVPGSGIGLGVCKRVVEQHGGRIWVESDWQEEGGGGRKEGARGSRFYFTLPGVGGEEEGERRTVGGGESGG